MEDMSWPVISTPCICGRIGSCEWALKALIYRVLSLNFPNLKHTSPSEIPLFSMFDD